MTIGPPCGGPGFRFRPSRSPTSTPVERSSRRRWPAATLDIDVLYPAMGARVRSELATRIGAKADGLGCLVLDDHMRTNVPDLYAVGDVTFALDQFSVVTGHAAIAATDIHNTLPPNYR